MSSPDCPNLSHTHSQQQGVEANHIEQEPSFLELWQRVTGLALSSAMNLSESIPFAFSSELLRADRSSGLRQCIALYKLYGPEH